MNSGIKKIRHDHRDYDFHKSFGTVMPATIPDFNLDSGLWIPNQNYQLILGSLNVPALPNGCTVYTQDDLCIDEDGVLRDPMVLENITHANDKGGIDIRVALGACKQAYNHSPYYRIMASGSLDWFDAIRLSLYSSQDEKRSVSAGTAWYNEFENVGTDGILPMPQDFSIYQTLHNWKICGQKTVNGIPYLIGKSWQGETYGDKGFHYVSRELTNNLMSTSFAGAFTIARISPPSVQVVDSSFIQVIVSFIRNLFHL